MPFGSPVDLPLQTSALLSSPEFSNYTLSVAHGSHLSVSKNPRRPVCSRSLLNSGVPRDLVLRTKVLYRANQRSYHRRWGYDVRHRLRSLRPTTTDTENYSSSPLWRTTVSFSRYLIGPSTRYLIHPSPISKDPCSLGPSTRGVKTVLIRNTFLTATHETLTPFRNYRVLNNIRSDRSLPYLTPL